MPPKKKLAILLTGFLRRANETDEALQQHLASKHDATIFVATWDVADDARVQAQTQSSVVDATPVTTHDIVDFYGDSLGGLSVASFDLYNHLTPEIKKRDRPQDLFEINARAAEHGPYWMNRLFAQWYVVRQGLHLIEEYERMQRVQFDLICRTRTDILLDAPLPQWPANRMLVSHALPGGMASDRGWVPDWFMIGPAQEVKKLGELCWSIERLYDRQNIDTSNGENLLINYAVQQDIPLAVQEIPIRRI